MKELRIRVLAGVFLVAGVLSWAGARLWTSIGTLPSVPLAAPIVLALIAVVLLGHRSVAALPPQGPARAPSRRQGGRPADGGPRGRLRPGQRLVAALVSGMYGGTGVFLLESLEVPAHRDQAIYAASPSSRASAS